MSPSYPVLHNVFLSSVSWTSMSFLQGGHRHRVPGNQHGQHDRRADCPAGTRQGGGEEAAGGHQAGTRTTVQVKYFAPHYILAFRRKYP